MSEKPENKLDVIEFLAEHLPATQLDQSFTDSVMRRIRHLESPATAYLYPSRAKIPDSVATDALSMGIYLSSDTPPPDRSCRLTAREFLSGRGIFWVDVFLNLRNWNISAALCFSVMAAFLASQQMRPEREEDVLLETWLDGSLMLDQDQADANIGDIL